MSARHAPSLRWRLLAATAVAVALALLAAGFVLAGLFRQHALAQFDAQLRHQLDQLTAAVELDAQGRPWLKTPLSDPRWQTPYAGLYWQVEAVSAPASSAPVLRSRSLWDTVLQLPRDPQADGEVHRHPGVGPAGQAVRVLERTVRFETQGVGSGPEAPAWRLLVAAQTDELETAVDHFTRQLALYLAVLGGALWLAAWAQVGLGLRPLHQLQAAVQAVRRAEAPRLAGTFPAEVAPLVDDFNRVLDQNQQGVQRARQMAGNLAHAIKTPLAVLGQLAHQLPDAATARQMTEQVDTVRRQVDWHLGRARAAGAGAAGLRTPVAPVLDGLVRVMQKVHAVRGDAPPLTIQVDCTPDLVFDGETQDLQEMVGNLLDNACKWGRGQVLVRAGPDQGRLCLTVSDDGPGLPEALCEQVLARGVRADEQVPGSGLGLDIVREVARLYGGTLALDRAELGGLRATLCLPGHAESAPASTCQ